ncbi:MAG: type 4a pilus biogenesis protein PilO [Desulfobacterales bacterium]|nr:type 4a pilus biogenesis protein PilO [Desulfobacterales bacterium]
MPGSVFIQRPALDHKGRAGDGAAKDLDALTGGDVSAVYRADKSDLAKLQAMIPPKRRFAPLLGDVMESATVCRVSSEALTYKPEYLRERKVAYRMALSVRGRYASLRCFLNEMQTRKELVVIDGMTLKSEDPYAENVSMELKLTAYLRDDRMKQAASRAFASGTGALIAASIWGIFLSAAKNRGKTYLSRRVAGDGRPVSPEQPSNPCEGTGQPHAAARSSGKPAAPCRVPTEYLQPVVCRQGNNACASGCRG